MFVYGIPSFIPPTAFLFLVSPTNRTDERFVRPFFHFHTILVGWRRVVIIFYLTHRVVVGVRGGRVIILLRVVGGVVVILLLSRMVGGKRGELKMHA